MQTETSFPHLLQAYFTERLMHQRHASPHTIASYRTTFCLLLQFAQQQLHKAPSSLSLADLDAPFAQRLSGASRAGTGEQCQQSQCALGGAAFLLPLRRAVCTAV